MCQKRNQGLRPARNIKVTLRPHRYARLRSLCHLAAGQEGEYDLVDERDTRPKHIHKKYKLLLDQLGETWRIERPAP